MKLNIIGRNLSVSDDLREAVAKKLGKLDKFFSEDTEAQVVLRTERELDKIEITIPLKGTIIRAEEATTDMYASIDLAQESIERQMKRYRERLIRKGSEGLSKRYAEEEAEEANVPIVRTKRFAVKPMDAEEACMQMDLLGHSFYVFRNSETDEVNVVYKRKDGTFGLIEPEY